MLKKVFNFFRAPAAAASPRNPSYILVVDDNDVDRTLIENMLQKYGYRTLVAANGRMAMDMIKLQRPDLLILDCNMPIMDGVETCRLLRENETTRDMPVVFLTERNAPNEVIGFYKWDNVDYLSKPINAKVLVEQVSTILRYPSGGA